MHGWRERMHPMLPDKPHTALRAPRRSTTNAPARMAHRAACAVTLLPRRQHRRLARRALTCAHAHFSRHAAHPQLCAWRSAHAQALRTPKDYQHAEYQHAEAAANPTKKHQSCCCCDTSCRRARRASAACASCSRLRAASCSARLTLAFWRSAGSLQRSMHMQH